MASFLRNEVQEVESLGGRAGGREGFEVCETNEEGEAARLGDDFWVGAQPTAVSANHRKERGAPLLLYEVTQSHGLDERLLPRLVDRGAWQALRGEARLGEDSVTGRHGSSM